MSWTVCGAKVLARDLEGVGLIIPPVPAAGAVLFRGFKVEEGVEFQEVVRQYNPDLSDQYRGTSPRSLVPGTQVRYKPQLTQCDMNQSPPSLRSMSSQPVSNLHPTPSLSTWRWPSSPPLPGSCSSAAWRRRPLQEGRPASVTSRRSMTRWTQRYAGSLRRRG